MITQLKWLDRLNVFSRPLNWEEIYAAELPRVLNYFRYLGLDEASAEDLTSATFEKAWRGRDTYHGEKGSCTAWLIGISRRVAADQYFSSQPELALDEIEDLPDGTQLEEVVQRQQEMLRLRSLLQRLPPRERELLALKYGAGLTNRAIAKMTGWSESNVGSILFRVVSALRAQMEQDHER